MTTLKICIDVADLDEAGAFYCQALQCTEVGRNPRTVKLTAVGNEYFFERHLHSGTFPCLRTGRGSRLCWQASRAAAIFRRVSFG